VGVGVGVDVWTSRVYGLSVYANLTVNEAGQEERRPKKTLKSGLGDFKLPSDRYETETRMGHTTAAAGGVGGGYWTAEEGAE
jgi:hypothetical protein